MWIKRAYTNTQHNGSTETEVRERERERSRILRQGARVYSADFLPPNAWVMVVTKECDHWDTKHECHPKRLARCLFTSPTAANRLSNREKREEVRERERRKKFSSKHDATEVSLLTISLFHALFIAPSCWRRVQYEEFDWFRVEVAEVSSIVCWSGQVEDSLRRFSSTKPAAST